jgi:Ca2+-binding EF-hand superfamily protein
MTSLDLDRMKFPDYVTAFRSIPTSVTDNDILRAFQVFDIDKTGVLQAEDILTCLTSFGEPLNKIEAKTFEKNLKIDERGFFNYNGRYQRLLPLHVYFSMCFLEFFMKFTQPDKSKSKKKKKKSNRSKLNR